MVQTTYDPIKYKTPTGTKLKLQGMDTGSCLKNVIKQPQPGSC